MIQKLSNLLIFAVKKLVHLFQRNQIVVIEISMVYTQYPIIRNGLIRNSAEFLGKFKKRALGRSNLRNASKNLRNGQCSDFQS